MLKIKNIHAHKFLNSRAKWTIGTTVELSNGVTAFHTVPDGASTGEDEALSLSAEKAVKVVNSVFTHALQGRNPLEQEEIDYIMIDLDKSENKKNLGGNSMLSVSLAIAKAAAKSEDLELYEYIAHLSGNKKVITNKSKIKFPTPVFNIINGGAHAQNNLSFQEFMVIPAANLEFDKKMQFGVDVYESLKKDLHSKNYSTAVGDEGGFAPANLTIKKALDLIKESIPSKYKLGKDAFFGMDVAANSFRAGKKYMIKEQDVVLSSDDLQKFYLDLIKKYPFIYIEDPFYEKEPNPWNEFKLKHGDKILVVGDDLVVTNPSILDVAINHDLCNAVIVKPNQVGTLTETLEFIQKAKDANLEIILSHRSGETAEDTTIADISIGVQSGFIKTGAPARGERVAKFNRLLQIYYSLL
jgi:enolase